MKQAGDRGWRIGDGEAVKPTDPGEGQGQGADTVRKQYGDFGPTLAAEKLAERDGITISDETLRGWLLETGVTHSSGGSARIGRGGSGKPIWGS